LSKKVKSNVTPAPQENNENKGSQKGERTNCMHRNRGNLTVGLKTETVGFVGLIFQRPQIFFHNFVSFHPILMFNTILESRDQTKTIEDESKTIRLILINT
jgi:hypothetical protein